MSNLSPEQKARVLLAMQRFGSCRYAKEALGKLYKDMESNGVRGGESFPCQKNSEVAYQTILGGKHSTDIHIEPAGIIRCAGCGSFEDVA